MKNRNLFFFLGALFVAQTSAVTEAAVATKADSKPEMVVTLMNKLPERLQFSNVTSGSVKGRVLTYEIGKEPLKTRVVPAPMYKKLISNFPLRKPVAPKAGAPCRKIISVQRGATPEQVYCDELLPHEDQVKFSTWFIEARQKLAE